MYPESVNLAFFITLFFPYIDDKINGLTGNQEGVTMKEEKLKYERKSSPGRAGSRLEREVDIKKYIGKYTVAFLALMGAMLLPLLAAGKSLIWTTDGKS